MTCYETKHLIVGIAVPVFEASDLTIIRFTSRLVRRRPRAVVPLNRGWGRRTQNVGSGNDAVVPVLSKEPTGCYRRRSST